MKSTVCHIFVCGFVVTSCAHTDVLEPLDPLGCHDFKGNYYFTFDEDPGGTCGILYNSPVKINNDGSLGMAGTCTTGPKASANSCAIVLDQTCTLSPDRYPPEGLTFQTGGNMIWDHDVQYALGTLTMVNLAPEAKKCSSSYFISATKLKPNGEF